MFQWKKYETGKSNPKEIKKKKEKTQNKMKK